MKISVITVCYNASKTISDTLKSIENQDYADLQYIVIDGMSTDGTIEILNERSDQIDEFISEKDSGIYHAMNKGIALATGDVIAFLNADDVYAHNSALSDVSKTFEKVKADSVYSDLQYVSADKPEKVLRYWKAGPYKRERFKNGWMPPHPTFFAKKELFEKFGSFNTDFKISADYELMLRFLFKHRASAAYLPCLLVKMKVGGKSNQSINSRIIANREDRKAWKVNGLRQLPYTTVLKPIRKISQFWS